MESPNFIPIIIFSVIQKFINSCMGMTRFKEWAKLKTKLLKFQITVSVCRLKLNWKRYILLNL